MAAGARPARRERHRDPGHLPRTCRRRAVAAGAPATARPAGHPAAGAPACRARGETGRARPASGGGAADERTTAPAPAPAAATGAADRTPSIFGARGAVVTRFDGANAIVIAALARRPAPLGRGHPPARHAARAGAGRGDHRRDFRHCREEARRPVPARRPRRERHPVRGHQLFQRQPQSADVAGAIARASAAARRPPRSTARPVDHHQTLRRSPTRSSSGGQFDPRRHRRLRRPRLPHRQRDLRSDHQRGEVRHQVEPAPGPVDHDARQSGGADPGRPGDPGHHRPGAVATISTMQFRTVQRENVGIKLEVRPQINAGGAIKLYLRQEVSSIAGPVGERLQRPDPQQARDRDGDHRRRRRDRRHRRPARRQ